MHTINQLIAITCRDAGKGREQERKLYRSVRTAHPTVARIKRSVIRGCVTVLSRITLRFIRATFLVKLRGRRAEFIRPISLCSASNPNQLLLTLTTEIVFITSTEVNDTRGRQLDNTRRKRGHEFTVVTDKDQGARVIFKRRVE